MYLVFPDVYIGIYNVFYIITPNEYNEYAAIYRLGCSWINGYVSEFNREICVRVLIGLLVRGECLQIHSFSFSYKHICSSEIAT